MTNAIIQSSEAFVQALLTDKLTPDHRYHDLAHTLAVRDACRLLSDAVKLDDDQRETLELAALFHDTGFTVVYDGHEAESCRLAEEFLAAQGYPRPRIDAVVDCIQATVPPHTPTHRLQEIIKDADLSNLARTDYLALLDNLRYEWAVFRQETYTDAEWYRLNHQFLKNHVYFTVAARERFDITRKQNQSFLKEMAKKAEKKAQQPAAGAAGAIVNSRGAQMMFKTALRNHIDLSNLADNKANMMLSVNALIITIAMPLGISQAPQHAYLLPPLLVLLVSCLGSMIFATLATRPMRMHGYTRPEDIASGNANLFFFGNFFDMSYKEFDAGMDQVLQRDMSLENAIKRDLYFLGRSLGRKYRLLRICYNVFMVGLIIAIVVFGVSFLIYGR